MYRVDESVNDGSFPEEPTRMWGLAVRRLTGERHWKPNMQYTVYPDGRIEEYPVRSLSYEESIARAHDLTLAD